MKESEGWLILAEEFDAGRTGDTMFLCNALESHADLNTVIQSIPLTLRERMVDRIDDNLDPHYSAAYRDTKPDTHGARTLACLLFSEVARDEGD